MKISMTSALLIVSPRALNEVSTAFWAGFFPFPSLSFAFWGVVSAKQQLYGDTIFYCEICGLLRFLFGTLGHLIGGSRASSFGSSNFDSFKSTDIPAQRHEKGFTRRYRPRLMLCSAFDNPLVVFQHPEETPKLIYE